MNFLAQKRKHILLRESPFNKTEHRAFSDDYFKQVAKLIGAGGWSIHFDENKSYFDQEARRILKLPADYSPSFQFALDFYAPESHVLAMETFEACKEGQPFSLEFKMLTYHQVPFWAKVVGAPMYNEDQIITGIHIVFQDINEAKSKELELAHSLEIAKTQNARLLQFAETISHSIRSHAGNLSLTLDLMNSANGSEEEKELTGNIHEISKSLNTTVADLNEIVQSQIKGMTNIGTISLVDSFKEVTKKLQRLIQERDVEIYTDFSEVPEISYVPEYIESIFEKLLSNAIHYAHPDRTPSIDIFSYYEDQDIYLMVKDNGMGIDLTKHQDHLFQLYRTFHNRAEAKGIDLFILKNQIESINGTIDVESTVGTGTTFRIKLN